MKTKNVRNIKMKEKNEERISKKYRGKNGFVEKSINIRERKELRN